MDKYIIDFKRFGINDLEIDSICKDWRKDCFITKWTSKEVTYKICFKYSKKKADIIKTAISEEQALLLIDKLDLIEFQTFFNSGTTFYKREKIEDMIETTQKEVEKYSQFLTFSQDELNRLTKSLINK